MNHDLKLCIKVLNTSLITKIIGTSLLKFIRHLIDKKCLVLRIFAIKLNHQVNIRYYDRGVNKDEHASCLMKIGNMMIKLWPETHLNEELLGHLNINLKIMSDHQEWKLWEIEEKEMRIPKKKFSEYLELGVRRYSSLKFQEKYGLYICGFWICIDWTRPDQLLWTRHRLAESSRSDPTIIRDPTRETSYEITSIPLGYITHWWGPYDQNPISPSHYQTLAGRRSPPSPPIDPR